MGLMRKLLNILSMSKSVESDDALYDVEVIDDPSSQDLAPLKDSTALPTCIEDFQPCHFKVLRRLNKHPVKEAFSGYMTLEVDIPNFIPILINLGLVYIASYEESLSLSTTDVLKAILRQSGRKVSGNKQDLINRILQDTEEQIVRNLEIYSDYYLITDMARKIISESYDRFALKEYEFYKLAIDKIIDEHLDEAYRIICKRNAEIPGPQGMNLNWRSEYYSGISSDRKTIFINRLRSSDNKSATAIAIFCDISGESISKVQRSLESMNREDIAFESNCHNVNTDFSSYVESGIDKYLFLAALDAQTCPICGRLDGKIFYVKDKKVGVNFPPMHDGCRCTTTAVIDGHAPSVRRARDIYSGKSEIIPYITYTEWIKQYN